MGPDQCEVGARAGHAVLLSVPVGSGEAVKQVLQSYRTGELWLAEVDPPKAAPHGARVRTRASLLSAGTEKLMLDLARKGMVGKARARPDLVRRVLQKVRQEGVLRTFEQVRDKLNVPVPMGYACAGVVADAEGAGALVPGMRVACAGATYACHAEMNWVPRNLVVPLPDRVSFEEGAFATIGAIALQAVRQAEVRLGDRVVVIGLGLIGNLCAQLAAAHGARVVGFDLSASRTAQAERLGCQRVSNTEDDVREQTRSATDGFGADAVIVAASAPGDPGPLSLAVELARMRGRVIVVGLVGMEIPREEAYAKELDVRMSMSYGPGRYDPTYEEGGQDYPYAYVRYTEQRNMLAFLETVEDGRVSLGPLISHRFPIDRALDAYALLGGREPYLGILLTYGDEPQEPALPKAPAAAVARAPAVEPVRGRVGVGVLGAGSYVRGVLLPALRRLDVDRVGLVTRTGASAAQASSAAGFRWSGTDTRRLLEDPSVDAVIIGTRHRLHAEQVVAALRARKHVFVEKPLCLSEVELDAIARLQEETGRYLQVGTNRRFSPYTEEMRREFAGRADPLALTCRVNAGRLPASHWLRDPVEGGGRLVGEGIHFVDWCQAVVGSPVRRVLAVPMGAGPTSLPGDTFAVVLSFGDGSLAQIFYAADGDRGLTKERYEVFGLGRVAILDDWSEGWVYREGRKRRLKLGRGQQKGVAEQLQAFLGALRSGRPAVPPDVTWHVQHVTLAAAASLADGLPREVVWPRPASDGAEEPQPSDPAP